MQELTRALLSAKNILIVTGAGVSAESGVPTFRDALTGLWANFKPEELATPSAYNNDPTMVWKWYQMRRQQLDNISPNPGHYSLAQLQGLETNVNIVTQNVDGLHQLAGSKNVIEYHGNIRENKCNNCEYRADNENNHSDDIPNCPKCNERLRPAVVWFGESIPEEAAFKATRLAKEADLFLSIGTSSQVYPAAGLVEYSRSNRGLIAEINPHSTPLTSSADIVISEKSGEFLPKLIDELNL